MISVEEALAKILDAVNVLEAEEKPLLACLGQVLDEDITSTLDLPPLDNSAMDGYAVIAHDTEMASPSSPVFLDVIGEVAAGQMPSTPAHRGAAIRIMTGAPVPPGADAVVKFEDTDETDRKGRSETGAKIGITQPVAAGLNIRPKGEDISRGSLVLKKGTLLRPAEIGILASLGRPQVNVIRRPVVSVLPTGDELCDIHQPLAQGHIYDSNTYTIAANVARCGGIPKVLKIARDSMDSLNAGIESGLDADMLITSGGVSMGDYDVVKDALAQMGRINFWTVRMKPGKPLAFGVIDKTSRGPHHRVPHLGLPGNPVSSMTTFEMFARPAIFKMMGKRIFERPTVTATIDQDVHNTDGRRVYTRVYLERDAQGWKARVTGPQGSGILTSMSSANGLAVIPEDCPLLKAGEKVQVRLLDESEETLGGFNIGTGSDDSRKT
jgi:molybdopterin molybdotransferase